MVAIFKTAPGLWGDSTVPKTGWVCLEIKNLGHDSMICEMCQTAVIHFTHFMRHDQWGDLICGCVCAGKMEGNPDAAARREKMLKNTLGRRNRWLTRSWRCSDSGNQFLNARGWNVVVFQKGEGYAFRLRRSEEDPELKRYLANPMNWALTEKAYWSSTFYQTEDSAKLASFDAIEWLIKRGK